MNNSDAPLISVVMSVYNGEDHLAEAIDSVLSQSYSNLELIIVNDGSSDGSIDIINRYITKDDRIVVIDRENKGLPYSLNEGISKAKGEYIARMDADDICVPDRLEKQIKYMINRNLDVCGSYIKNFGDDLHDKIIKYPVTHNDITFKLMFSPAFAHPTVMLKKEVFNKASYNNKYKVAQDYQLWIDILNSNFKMANIPEVLLMYRIHKTQASKSKVKMQQNIANQIALNHLKDLDPKHSFTVSEVIKSRSNANVKGFYELLKEVQRLGEKNDVTKETIGEMLKEIYNLATPKNSKLYLAYLKASKSYQKDLKDEIKMCLKSLFPKEDSSTFKLLKRAQKQLKL